MVYMFLVALCAACISYTICWTSIFKPLREWLSKFHPKLEELIHCPYCFSHYVILVIMLTTQNVTDKLAHISYYLIYDFIFTWFCIVCITSLIHYVMLRAYKPVIDYMTDRELEKLQKSKKADKS